MIDGEILSVKAVEAGYGRKRVLFGIDLFVRTGEMVALIGHNGAGKSTLLKALFGIVPPWTGEVFYRGEAMSRWTVRERIDRGIAYVPEGNRVFTELTVRENLEMGGYTLDDNSRVRRQMEEVCSVFPVLAKKSNSLAATLSGGEKQMLALANTLMLSPRLLLLDEPSLGLSPSAVREALGKLIQINRSSSTAMLIVEQKVREVLRICSRAYLMKMGRIAYAGDSSVLLEGDRVREIFL